MEANVSSPAAWRRSAVSHCRRAVRYSLRNAAAMPYLAVTVCRVNDGG